jgi:hypothetical protein
MSNNAQRARFWIDIICSRCHYPAPERLRAQFEAAELSDFCACGCNSFGVSLLNPEISPVCGPHSRYGAFFEASFYTSELGKNIEIILFADESGHLKFVEVNFCANAFPVPDDIRISDEPFFVRSAKSVIF